MHRSVPDEFGVRDGDLVEIVLPNDLRAVRPPEEQIMRELLQRRYSDECRFAIRLALEEALTNAVRHGNRNDASKRLRIRYHISPKRVIIAVRDEGAGFRLDRVADPTKQENLERPSGRGIMLMNAYMTKVRYNETGNEVWLLKERAARAKPVSRK